MKEQRRSYFRVSDNFIIVARKAPEDILSHRPSIIDEFYTGASTMFPPDDAASGALARLLVEVNAKLSVILNKLSMENEGLVRGKEQHVNISAGGLQCVTPDSVALGQILEISMILPSSPHEWIRLYGKITRADQQSEGGTFVGVEFIEMTDEVRDRLLFYTLNRQREMRRELKSQEPA